MNYRPVNQQKSAIAFIWKPNRNSLYRIVAFKIYLVPQ